MLSREAVKRFYQESGKANSTCQLRNGMEDVEIAKCLRITGVYMGKSVDEQNRERFHAVSFFDHFIGPMPGWLESYAENKPLVVSGIFPLISFENFLFYILREKIAVVIRQYRSIMSSQNCSI